MFWKAWLPIYLPPPTPSRVMSCRHSYSRCVVVFVKPNYFSFGILCSAKVTAKLHLHPTTSDDDTVSMKRGHWTTTSSDHCGQHM